MGLMSLLRGLREPKSATTETPRSASYRCFGRERLTSVEQGDLKRRLLIQLEREIEEEVDSTDENDVPINEESALLRTFYEGTACPWTMQLQCVGRDGVPLDFADWARQGPVEALTVLRRFATWADEGFAKWDEETKTLAVPDLLLAQLSESEIGSLRLFPTRTVSLEIQRTGVGGDADCHLKPILRTDRILYSYELEGILLKRSRATQFLPPVLFMALDGIERWNASTHLAEDERKVAWARLSDLFRASNLPPLQDVAGHMRLISASQLSIELDPVTGDFRPYLLRPEYKEEGEERRYRPLLTAQQAKDFNVWVKSSLKLPKSFSLGNSTYLVLNPEARVVLDVIAKEARGTPAERAIFVANPRRAVLRALEGQGVVNADWSERLGQIFFETPDFLSKRVDAFGPWHPKSCAFVKPIKTNWFDDGDDHFMMTIAGRPTSVTEKEVRQLLAKIRRAEERGDSHITFKDEEFEVAEIDREALELFLSRIAPEKKEEKSKKDSGDDSEKSGKSGKIEAEHDEVVRFGPIITDNLKQLGYFAKINPRPDWRAPVKGFVNGISLYEHQQHAVEWLQDLWRRGIPGALLADDMGLGKTLQCLAFLKWIEDCQKEGDTEDAAPALIVAPTGLVMNWKQEAANYFGGNLPAPLVLTGREAGKMIGLPFSVRKERIEKEAWVITSYETMRDKIELFGNIRWGLVVFDEAQRIKTPISLVTECAKSLKQNFVLALTGTPVENSLTDLWSILDAVVPGFMGTLSDFNAKYVKADNPNESGRTLHELLTGQYEAAGEPVRLMMRRVKRDCLSALPAKRTEVRAKTMPPEQREAYREAAAGRRLSKSGAAPVKGKGSGLQKLQALMNVSLLPDPIDKGLELTDDVISRSGRLQALFEILDDIHAKNEKVIIFVNRVSVIGAVARAIQRRYNLTSIPETIEGSMLPKARQRVVNRFQTAPAGFDALVLSIRAASTGITLTAANHVIHLERWWNPAVEDQASDRVYRIGQKASEVVIHIPQAVFDVNAPESDRSFDAILEQFLNRKRVLSRSVLVPAVGENDEEELAQAVLEAAED